MFSFLVGVERVVFSINVDISVRYCELLLIKIVSELPKIVSNGFVCSQRFIIDSSHNTQRIWLFERVITVGALG
jgi:hypothetical protein